MICLKCGNTLRDDAKFCPYCGAVRGAAPSETGPVTGDPGKTADLSAASAGHTGPEAPVPNKKKRIGLLVGGGAALVAVIAAAVVLVGGLFASPKATVEKAFQKTAAAYSEAWDRMGIPDLDRLSEERSVSQRLSLELDSINPMLTGDYDLSSLKGLGLRMSTDLDGQARQMDMELAAYWGADDILSFQFLAEGEEMYLSIPQFTGDTFYGVNTRTLGADLAKLSGDPSVKDLSFDLFELIDLAAPVGQAEETEKAMKEANKALLDAMTVEKTGSETISVNGTETKTTVYRATIPEDALKDYVDAWTDAMSAVDYAELYEELLKAMGMPREMIDEIMYEMGDLDIYGELGDLLKQAVKVLGDVELDIYLSDGYVSAIQWEDMVLGSRVKMALYLGGGEEYVDDLRLELKAEGETIVIASSGDHGGRSGTFTDETTIRGPFPTISSDFSYEPGGSGDNLSWDLGIAGAGSLDMEGQLTTTEQSISLALDDVSVKVMGIEVCSLMLDYDMGPCEGMRILPRDTAILTQMSQSELLALGDMIDRNAGAWEDDMMEMLSAKLPADLFRALYYGYY